jgi:hypothetical protein
MDEELKVVWEGHPLPAQTMDLSENVLRMRFGEPLDPGTPIKINIDFFDSDQSAEHLEVDAEVLDRFLEPESESWQIGVRLKFTDAVQERNLQTHLSSCRGMF